MNFLSNLFPGVVGTLTRSGQLGSGGDPTRLRSQNERIQISNFSSLPVSTSPTEVVKAAEVSGRMDAEKLLLGRLAKHQVNTAQNALEIYKTRVDYSKEMMKIENQYQRLTAAHSKGVMRHGLGVQETVSNLAGYEAAFSQASNQLDF